MSATVDLLPINRIECPRCGTECMQRELSCWQCGANLHPTPAPEPEENDPKSPIKFDGLFSSDSSGTRTMTTLSGEVVDVPDISPPAATIGESAIAAGPQDMVMVL